MPNPIEMQTRDALRMRLLTWSFINMSKATIPGKNDAEIARIGNEIKNLLPTCAKLAEVFGEILHQKVNIITFIFY